LTLLPSFVCPRTRGTLREGLYSPEAQVTYPVVDGLPVLVPEPVALLGQTTVRRLMDAKPSNLGLPDALTPHLPPALFAAPAGFGQWLGGLGDSGPEVVCAGFAERHAPTGPALDVGCGVGTMTRRMVAAGRAVAAFDVSLDAVLLARGLLCGQLQQVTIPTYRGGQRTVRVPFKPVTSGLSFCVADAANPPFAPGSFAWVHLGDVLDSVGDSVGDVLVASAELLARGGLLTISTSYGAESCGGDDTVPPDEELVEARDRRGLHVVDQADRVARVGRAYDRAFDVRFLHCIAATRA
jgi:SAM-dependent methyltransferase/uncharacterized protein YbaR (Trm112 family)